MNKLFLKTLRDNIPDTISYATAVLIRNKLLHNRDFKRYYRLLADREYCNESFKQKWQFNHLKKLLIHCGKNVPYYRNLFKNLGFIPEEIKTFDDIKILPYLTKEDVQRERDQFISEKPVPGGFYEASTGGTTGEPLRFLLDYQSIFIENAFIYSYRRKLGYEFDDKLVTFRGGSYRHGFYKYNPMYNELMLSPFKLTKQTLSQYLIKINSYQPDYIHGYLSSIYYLACLLHRHKRKIRRRLKGIFLISENIDEQHRRFVEDFFQVPSLTFYGHSERSVIAYETEKNCYQFDPFYGYTEFEDLKDGSRRIIGTGFLNKIMPLIRYKTDDVCKGCVDGVKIYGKRDSNLGLYGKNHEFFTQPAFNFHSDSFKNVLQSQFVQTQVGKAKLLLVANNSFCKNDENNIIKELDKAVHGAIDIDVEVVDKIKLSPRGKFKLFYNVVKNPG